MRIGILTLFSFFPSFVFSQDYIYKVDSSRIAAKVLEVNPYSIKYQLYNSPDTSIYILNKEFIVLVVYANGTYDMFSPVKVRKKNKKNTTDSLSLPPGKNIASFNLFETLLGNASLGYERIFLKGKLGVRIPAILSLQYSSLDDSYNKHWATGLDIKYYPSGQGKARFYLGPSFETGQYKYIEFYNSGTIKEYRKYALALANSGFSFQLTQHLNISVETGLGIRYKDYRKSPEPAVKIGYNIGFRF